MIGKKQKKYTPEFKFRLALETLRNESVPSIAKKYGVNASLLAKWKSIVIKDGYHVFETTPDKEQERMKKKISKLEQMIGKKEVELNLLKNFSDFYESQNGE